MWAEWVMTNSSYDKSLDALCFENVLLSIDWCDCNYKPLWDFCDSIIVESTDLIDDEMISDEMVNNEMIDDEISDIDHS